MPSRKPTNRNPILKLGGQRKGQYAKLPNELVRQGVAEMGSDAVCVMAFLLSQSSGYETSAAAISQEFGWGANRTRAGNALAALEKANRIVIREYVNGDGNRVRQQYIFPADGRRMSDAEIQEWSAAVVVGQRPCTEIVQGGGRA